MRYFTADLHLTHPKLAGLRGFSTVVAHDAAVMAALYRLDPERDELWVLGDICAGGVASMQSALAQLATLPYSIHALLGNHDPAHPMYRGADRHAGAFAAVFTTVAQHGQVDIGGEAVLLSHFPYAGTPDRFDRTQFDTHQLPDRGGWLVHGHTHSAERRSGPRSICVSLEAWGLRPASEEELAALMNA